MKSTTYKMIQLTMEADAEMSAADREAILAICREPALAVVRNERPQAPTIRWLTPNQVADALSVSLRTVQRHIQSGLLPSRRIGGSRRIPSDVIGNPLPSLPKMPWPVSSKSPPQGVTSPADCNPNPSSEGTG